MNYYVAIKGKTPKRVRLIKPPCKTVEEARARRAKSNFPPEETCIYGVEWGKKLQFIEGAKIV